MSDPAQGYQLTDEDKRRAAVWQSVYGLGGVLHSKTGPAPWPTEPSPAGIKDWGPLPAQSATSPQRIAWIRNHARPYVQFMAFIDLAGVAQEYLERQGRDGISAKVEALLAATGIAETCGLPFDDGAAAGNAEWSAATERGKQFVDDLRRAVFPLARVRAAGEIILNAAHQVNDRYGCALPGELLTEACRVIAASAAPRSQGRR